MTPAERAFALQQLSDSRERMMHLLQGLSPDQLVYRPQPERWSIAENVEHVLVVEKRLVVAIEKLLQEPPCFSKQCSLDDAEVLRQVATVVQRIEAPPHARPKMRWPAETLPHEFATVRQRTRDFASTTKVDLRRQFIPHFLFGELDCYQWLLLIGAHCHRHSAQCEALKSSPRFPS